MKTGGHLCSACRSTPTEGGAEMVARIVGPKTATSFNNIFNDTFTCLQSQNVIKSIRTTVFFNTKVIHYQEKHA